MGLIAKVIDLYHSGRVRWQRGSYASGSHVCIMGAIGLVLRRPLAKFDINGHVHRTFAGWEGLSKSDNWTLEEAKELTTFYEVIRDNYSEFFGSQYGSRKIPLDLFSTINRIVNWNDRQVISFEKDVLPMLEKTAIRLAERVSDAQD